MHNKQKLKKLALLAANGNKIPTDIEQFVLTCLNKQDLKTFLHYYKASLSKKRIYVTSAKEVSSENIKNIQKLYSDKEIIVTLDENLGAGIKLQQDDLVVDFTFKKYINDTIEKLKN